MIKLHPYAWLVMYVAVALSLVFISGVGSPFINTYAVQPIFFVVTTVLDFIFSATFVGVFGIAMIIVLLVSPRFRCWLLGRPMPHLERNQRLKNFSVRMWKHMRIKKTEAHAEPQTQGEQTTFRPWVMALAALIIYLLAVTVLVQTNAIGRIFDILRNQLLLLGGYKTLVWVGYGIWVGVMLLALLTYAKGRHVSDYTHGLASYLALLLFRWIPVVAILRVAYELVLMYNQSSTSETWHHRVETAMLLNDPASYANWIICAVIVSFIFAKVYQRLVNR